MRRDFLSGDGDAVARILSIRDTVSKSNHAALAVDVLICNGELKGEIRSIWISYSFHGGQEVAQQLFEALDTDERKFRDVLQSGALEGRHVCVGWETPGKYSEFSFKRATPDECAEALAAFPWAIDELDEDTQADMMRTFNKDAQWSRLTDERDNKPMRRPMPELVRMLSSRRISSDKHGIPMFMPVTHKTPDEGGIEHRGGWRVLANALDSWFIALDIDGQPEERILTFLKALQAENVAFLSTTSHSNTNKIHKLRIVIPLARGISPEEYTHLFWQLDTLSGGAAYHGILDENCRTASFQFFAPSCPQGQLKHAEALWSPGEALDPDAWHEHEAKTRVKDRKREPSQDIDTSTLDKIVPLSKRLDAFKEWLRSRAPEIKGKSPQKHTFRTWQNGKAYGLSLAQALPLMREWDAKCDPPWGDRLTPLGEDAYRYSESVGFGARWSDHEGSEDDDPIMLDPNWPRVVDEIVCRLAQRMQGELFQRGGELVLIRYTDEGVPEIEGLDDLGIQACAMKHAPLWKDTKDGLERVVPDQRLMGMLATEKEAWKEIPVLLDLCPKPTLRQDGSVFSTTGYDPKSKLYLIEGQELAIGCSRADARDAVRRLLEVIRLTSFDDISRSTWLSFVITLCCRNFIAGNIPGFASDAPAEGSGKGLVIHAANTIATGRRAVLQPFPSREEKLESEVFAAARSGVGLLYFDNLERALEGSSLEAAMTSERIRSRKFHAQHMIEAPFRCVVVVTGNNISFKGTTHRRFLTMAQNPGAAPHLRTSDDPLWGVENLLRYVREHQADLLAAALTIPKAYALSGDHVPHNPLGGFEDWADKIASALIWSGAADPIRGNISAGAEVEIECFNALLKWCTRREFVPFYARELHEFVTSVGFSSVGSKASDRESLLAGIEGLLERKIRSSADIGQRILSRLRDRDFDGRSLRAHEDRKGVLQWQIMSSSAVTDSGER